MDISFKTPSGRFNYRVSAVIIRDGCLLTMSDNHYSYSYLPGGRVKMGESSRQAMEREIREELQAELPVLRLLWLCEDFFTEADSGERFHEICLYYLVNGNSLPREAFSYIEGDRINHFAWTRLEQVKNLRLYPEFIGRKICQLPDHPEMIIEQN